MAADRATSCSSDRFYDGLPTFVDFPDFADFSSYEPVPDDWIVMLADVRDSTHAIEAGRYKDVNMVGAASITAVLNACGGTGVPFVFGGDGGTVVVPGALREAASNALIGLEAISQTTFGLPLRVGAVPVADLRAGGADIRVRKYQLSPGNHLAMFAGGGIQLADRLLKSARPGSRYLLQARGDTARPDLQGLSCRWQPLIPRGGCMMTIMIQGTSLDQADENALLGTVVSKIIDLLGRHLRDLAPASPYSMRFRWPPGGVGLEARASAGRQSVPRRYLAVLASSLVQFWCERFDTKAGPYDAPVYRDELRSNTDYLKFDGILRMVLDVSQSQAERIERLLQHEHDAGRLVYGVHRSNAALMTCLVFSFEQSRHVHFIDGADGGFARAAQEFKARLDALR